MHIPWKKSMFTSVYPALPNNSCTLNLPQLISTSSCNTIMFLIHPAFLWIFFLTLCSRDHATIELNGYHWVHLSEFPVRRHSLSPWAFANAWVSACIQAFGNFLNYWTIYPPSLNNIITTGKNYPQHFFAVI